MTPPDRSCATAGIALVVSIALSAGADAACFAPLSDRASRNPADFQDLAKTTTARKMEGVVEFLALETTGETVANIDFYSITFARHRTKTLEQVFKDLRLNFNTFAEGTTKDFGFDAYGATWDEDDRIRKKNYELWKKDVPLDAVMSFNLDTLWPDSVQRSDMTYKMTKKDGDLQVTCATKTDFVFSTLKSKRGGSHPVSGNRGFGIRDNGDGTWTFYSKAVDRGTSSFKNWMAENVFSEDVFCLGHGFWLLFYGEMKRYLNSQGMNVKEIWNKNHGPVPFPFKTGPQPSTKECK